MLFLLAGAVAAAVFFLTREDSAMPFIQKGRVQKRYNAQGVKPQLIELLDAWEARGTHDVIIPDEIPGVVFPAGVRSLEAQQQAYAAGLSKVTKGKHNVGEALDVHPVGFNPRIAWSQQPQDIRAKFYTFGVFAENFVAKDGTRFVAGMRWRNSTFPDGDQPHVEMVTPSLVS